MSFYKPKPGEPELVHPISPLALNPTNHNEGEPHRGENKLSHGISSLVLDPLERSGEGPPTGLLDLPLVIVHDIIDSIPTNDYETLASLCLTCSAIYPLARERLYRDLVFDFTFTTWEVDKLLECLLLPGFSSKWRHHVRTVEIIGEHDGEYYNSEDLQSTATSHRMEAMRPLVGVLRCIPAHGLVRFSWRFFFQPPRRIMDALLVQKNMTELMLAASISQADLAIQIGVWGAVEYFLERLDPERCKHLKIISLSHLRNPTRLKFLPYALANAKLEKLELHVESKFGRSSWPNIKDLTDIYPLGSGLSQLQELVLCGFDLDKAERNVPRLFNLKTLRVLRLIDCKNIDQLLWWLSQQPINSRVIREIMIGNLDNIERNILPGCVSSWISSCKNLTVLQLDISCFRMEAMDDLIEAVLESKDTLEALRLNLSRNPWAHPDQGGGFNVNNPELLFFPPHALNELCTFPKLQELSLCLDMSALDLGSLYPILPPNLLVLEVTLRSREAVSLPGIAGALADLAENAAFLRVAVVGQTALWRTSSGRLWARCFLVNERDISVLNDNVADVAVPGVGKLGELRMNIQVGLEFTARLS